MKRIDIHTHILPATWPDWNSKFNSDGWLTMVPNDNGTANMLNSNGTLFRVVQQNCWSPEQRVKEIEAKGVTMQVLSTVPGTGFNYNRKATDAYEVAQFLNDHLANVVQGDPKHFLGLGTVPMQDIKMAVCELRRCVNELGMVGVQIGTSVNGKNLEDEEFEPFWEEVEKLECAVFIHPWDMSTDDRYKKHWFQWTLGMPHETATAIASMAFGGVFEKHPKLRVCFAHGGGNFAAVVGRLHHAFEVRPDLCQTCTQQRPERFFRQMYFDSLVHDKDNLKLLVDKFGDDRIIFGTDYPFPLGEIERPGGLIEDVFKDNKSVQENLLWNNACEFLGLDKGSGMLKNPVSADPPLP